MRWFPQSITPDLSKKPNSPKGVPHLAVPPSDFPHFLKAVLLGGKNCFFGSALKSGCFLRLFQGFVVLMYREQENYSEEGAMKHGCSIFDFVIDLAEAVVTIVLEVFFDGL